MRSPEHPRPSHLIAHFSDTHLRHPDDPLIRGVLDPRVPLADLLAGLLLSGHSPEALLFTGDLSDDQTPESYDELRALVEPMAGTIGATVFWAVARVNRDSLRVRVQSFNELFGVPAAREALLDGADPDSVIDAALPGDVAFEQATRRYRLYR